MKTENQNTQSYIFVGISFGMLVLFISLLFAYESYANEYKKKLNIYDKYANL